MSIHYLRSDGAAAMIDIRQLTKTFGAVEALRGVDLTFERGTITALMGPNGSGKSTLIKCILGLTRPSSGEIIVDGEPINGEPGYRRRIGYMPQAARFPENLTAREVITMLRDLRGNPADVDTSLVEAFRLEAELDKPVRTLSGGNRQKVSVVIAFMFRPEVLILDEPTAGLDPIASGILKDKILEVRSAGRTVILATHIMSEIEELADRIAFLLEGRLRFNDTADAIKIATGESRLERAIAKMMSRAA